MRVLFDLDNTLIDTERIKRGVFYSVAMEYGLSKDAAKQVYRSVRNVNGKIIFTPRVFAAALGKHLNISEPVEETIVETLYTRLKQIGPELPLSGAKELIQTISQKSIPFYLLTLGVPEWQKEKVWYAGLKEYFPDERCLFTESTDPREGKIIAIQEHLKEIPAEIVLFNDKPDETATILEVFPHMKALVRRDTKDERFVERDFNTLQEKFEGRFWWSQSLIELKDIFENLFVKNKK